MKKSSLHRILVPVDFSKLSMRGIEVARGLAGRFGAVVHLIHVHDYFYPAGFMAGWETSIFDSMRSHVRETEAKLKQRLIALARKFELDPGNCHLRSGTPTFDQVVRFAREIEADLIVNPTHGYTGINHFFEGSTAERIVQHSTCPVLVIKDQPASSLTRGKIDRIFVPVDFSACSLGALRSAIQLAERFAARVIVFHAVHLGYAATSDGYAMYDLSRFEKAARQEADKQMREFMHCAKFGSVKYETVIKVGPPVDEICAYAENLKADLIVTATHGWTGLKHVLIGSTAEQIVRRANVPVLVAPSHPEVRATHLSQASMAQPEVSPSRRRGAGGKRNGIARALLPRGDQKRGGRAFPERRLTNRFRESHVTA